MNTILIDQNKPELIKLLKAQRVSYSVAKKIQNFEWIVQIISLLSPIIGFLALPKQYSEYALVLTTIFAITYVATYYLGKFKTNVGARIQEQFDTELFGISWNKYLCKTKVESNEILKLAKYYSKNDLNDWYSKEIKPELKKNIGILLCQNTNIVWDNNLRKSFVMRLLVFTIIYFILFIIYLYNINKPFAESLLLLMPSLPSVIYVISNIINQREIIKNKQDLKRLIDDLFEKYKENRQEPNDGEIRNIQDLIFLERNKTEKIHNWFYYFYKSDMEKDTDEYIKTLINEFHLNF